MKQKLLIFLSLLLFTTFIFAQDAAQWRGKQRDGIYNESGLLKSWPTDGPKLSWHFDSLGDGHASAAIDIFGTIYTAGMRNGKGCIFSFSPEGKLIWCSPYGEEWTESYGGPRSTPVINDGKVYMISGFGLIVCMTADKGSILWTVDLMKDYGCVNIKWGVTENLLIDGNRLYCTVGGEKHNVIALNKNNGSLIWSCPGNGEVSAYCSPQLINLPTRKIVVTMTENSILGIDAETGVKLWSHEQKNKWSVHANTPLFHDGSLYCMSGYGYGGVMLKVSADGASIEKSWFNATLDCRFGGMVLINGLIYGLGDAVKGLHCLEWSTGKEVAFDKWNGKPGNIIAADGMIYTYDESGAIDLVQPTATGFTRISGFKVPYGTLQHWAHPVINKGLLYVRHGNSLMVYDIRN